MQQHCLAKDILCCQQLRSVNDPWCSQFDNGLSNRGLGPKLDCLEKKEWQMIVSR